MLVAILSPVRITSNPRDGRQVTRSKSYGLYIFGRENKGTSDSNAPRQEADHSERKNEKRSDSKRTDDWPELSGPKLGSDARPFNDGDCVWITDKLAIKVCL